MTTLGIVLLSVSFVLVTIFIGVLIFTRTERFGKLPQGDRLQKVKNSPHYIKGSFQNLVHTPMLTEGVGFSKVLFDFLFASKPKPPGTTLPSIKTDLKELASNENVLIWMGHSSYFMQVDGKKILVDPVLSGNASPLASTTKAFKGSDIYFPEDFQEIDLLLLTHDHWDHMDYKTLKNIRPKVNMVITGLGNGAHLERWGYEPKRIIEKDWYSSIALENGFSIHVTPARHFSGRGFKRNQTLWVSFILSTPTFNIFLGGDSGYGPHFEAIGDKYGPFDLAILENGQYDEKWQYIHMLPNEQFKAVKDLKTKAILPVHSGKFTLANHPWTEPLTKITTTFRDSDIDVLTPKIGEPVELSSSAQNFEQWWTSLEDHN